LCKLGLLNILSREEEKVLAPEPVLMSACCRGHDAQLVRKGAAGLQGELQVHLLGQYPPHLVWIPHTLAILDFPGLLKSDIPTLCSIFIIGIKHASKEVSLAALKCTTTFLA
jgi:hypothetical protein